MKIINIYFGTRGLSGLYIKEIERIQNVVFKKVISIISFHSIYKNKKNFVYVFSDSELSNVLPKKIRLAIRYIELLIAMIISLVKIMIYKPDYVNYSITIYRFEEYLFLKIVNLLKIKIILTVHDAILHKNKNIKSKKRLINRLRILKVCNNILVHNEFSKIELQKINDNYKFILHPFPCSKIPENLYDKSINRTEEFVFLGHAREEKGINLLLKVWKNNIHNKRLKIYGTDPFNILKNFKKNNRISNIDLNTNYLDDSKFIKQLLLNKYLILPYTSGTNSQLPFLALSCGCLPIMSNVPAFEYFNFNTKLTFKKNNEESLLKMINSIKYNFEQTQKLLTEYDLFYYNNSLIAYKKLYETNNTRS